MQDKLKALQYKQEAVIKIDANDILDSFPDLNEKQISEFLGKIELCFRDCMDLQAFISDFGTGLGHE